jgi:hypothetical protein
MPRDFFSNARSLFRAPTKQFAILASFLLRACVRVRCQVFPHSAVGLSASVAGDRISPLLDADDPRGQVSALVRRALDPWASDEVTMRSGFEAGSADGARWVTANAAVMSERPVSTQLLEAAAKFR